MQPIEKLVIIIIDPIIFPKIKPEINANGEPKPKSKTQITENKKKVIKKIKNFDFYNQLKIEYYLLGKSNLLFD